MKKNEKNPNALKKEKNLKYLIESNQINIPQIKELCRERYGLVNKEFRQKLWPKLLSIDKKNCKINSIDSLFKPDEKLVWRNYEDKKHFEAEQVKKDIDRTFVRYEGDFKLTKRDIEVNKIILNRMILAILKMNKFSYFQGFNDFCSIFLLILGEGMGFQAASICSKYLLNDFFEDKFEKGVIPIMNSLILIIKQKDISLFNLISEIPPSFALPWILTWFSHSIRNLDLTFRLFDYCISTLSPFTSLYLASSLILIKGNEIVKMIDIIQDDLVSAVYQCIQNINFDEELIENMITEAEELIKFFPQKKIRQILKGKIKFTSPLIDNKFGLEFKVQQNNLSIKQYEKNIEKSNSYCALL